MSVGMALVWMLRPGKVGDGGIERLWRRSGVRWRRGWGGKGGGGGEDGWSNSLELGFSVPMAAAAKGCRFQNM